MFEENGALLGELHAAGIARKQDGTQTVLELSDGLADGRLADKQLAGGAGNIAAFGDFVEDAVLGKILFHHQFSLTA